MTGTPTPPEQLSPRLAALKADLVALIPTRAQAALAELEGKPLTGVVIQYLTWRARLIRPRSRKVVIWPEVIGADHYAAYETELANIADGFRRGDDMNPYLSHQVRTHAYAAALPQPTATLTNEEWVRRNWRGKDRVRVTVDAHHLHLGGRLADGSVVRSGPLLFAGISRDMAFFLTLGDHNSFDDGTVSGIMHDRLEAELAAQGGGVALAGPMVTLAGTQVKDTMRAISIVKTVRALDNQLTQEGHAAPARTLRLDWDDIVVWDSSSNSEVGRVPGAL